MEDTPELREQLGKDLTRAQQARQIAESPRWIETFAEHEAKLMTAWRNTADSDVKERETIWTRVKIMDAVKREFEADMAIGRDAARTLDVLQTQAVQPERELI